MRNEREKGVIDAEARRCQAIADGDMGKLGSLLSDDYLHVHGDGRIGDKADYMVVRLFGDVAVLTGDLLNTIDFPDRERLVIDTSATFVLRETDGNWTFVSGQLTPKRKIV
jgi:ketosteroid isomerase-like protein